MSIDFDYIYANNYRNNLYKKNIFFVVYIMFSCNFDFRNAAINYSLLNTLFMRQFFSLLLIVTIYFSIMTAIAVELCYQIF